MKYTHNCSCSGACTANFRSTLNGAQATVTLRVTNLLTISPKSQLKTHAPCPTYYHPGCSIHCHSVSPPSRQIGPKSPNPTGLQVGKLFQDMQKYPEWTQPCQVPNPLTCSPTFPTMPPASSLSSKQDMSPFVPFSRRLKLSTQHSVPIVESPKPSPTFYSTAINLLMPTTGSGTK